jgi:hypothetical protein
MIGHEIRGWNETGGGAGKRRGLKECSTIHDLDVFVRTVVASTQSSRSTLKTSFLAFPFGLIQHQQTARRESSPFTAL